MKVMQLRSQETASGRKEYIVMGTTSVCGEEVQCKGKVCVPRKIVHFYLVRGRHYTTLQIIIFEVTEVIPEPGKPLTKHKIKVGR